MDSAAEVLPSESTQTVVIIDDEEIICNALVRIFASVGQPVVAFRSPREFLRSVDGLGEFVLVVDIRMPEMSGVALQAELRDRGIEVPLIFLSAFVDVPTALRVMRHGAFDVIQKPFEQQQLLDVVQRALAKRARQQAEESQQFAWTDRIARLTDRQREILELLAEGKANKVIASDLGLSQRTVEVHRAALMKRLGVRSLAEAVLAYARGCGTVELERLESSFGSVDGVDASPERTGF
jgi:FixJ family two-component response regulator